ncbi:APC family permease [Mangrovivirga sp. M17]|uniref:APC family permease n=1 Tax=Mangrovivirga halotolerans TaxID=2993936 RepID=A0ABT3RUT9_9BACT|nr:APC family permease [Mangrovivirga halotolerans]
MADSNNKLKPVSVWALTAGGMVGGGIYTVLGVVIAVSGQWTWLSFLITGIIAITSAYSYVFLSNKFNEGGGAFTFLKEFNDDKLAGSLSWLLIVGYVLTISVYAYAFGHYVAYSFHGGGIMIRILAAGIVAGLIILNLAGVGKMTNVEITIVSVNLLVLLILAVYGISQWNPAELVAGIEPRPVWSSLIGGAAIFMAYEGFQLLSYEYDRIKKPEKNFMPVLLSAVGFVVFLYILVAVGATMLGGAISMINFKQIALSIVAEKTFGTTGIIVMTIAAGFATAAAINSTLFSTANLAKNIADKNELPQWFDHKNDSGIPDRSIIFLGSLSGILAVTGSLSSLVEAASLIFIVTFGIVNFLAFQESKKHRWVPVLGIITAIITGIVLIFRLIISKPVAVGILMFLIILIVLGRPYLLNSSKK